MFAVRMLLIPLILFAAGSEGTALAAPAKIEEVAVGTLVKVNRSGGLVRLKKGDPLQSGDEVATDGETAVDIRLEDETLIRVGVSSVYKIQEDSKINSLIHRLLSGAVRVMVPKSETKTSAIKFRLFTPEGTIGVRGTEFVVIRSDGKTQLKGLDGTVMFGPAEADFANDSIFVNVGRGFQSSVNAKDKSAGKPEKFDLKKYLTEINSREGVFGPLAARVDGVRVHARADSTGASKPQLAASSAGGSAKPATKLSVEPAQKRPSGSGVNFQKMLLEGALDGSLAKITEALNNGADIDSTNDTGLSPLQLALTENDKKHKEVVLHLITNGANLDVVDEDGDTPLLFVIRNNLDFDYVESLVEAGGCDLTKKTRDGLLADELAEKLGNKKVVEYFQDDKVLKENKIAFAARKKREKDAEVARAKAAKALLKK